MKAREVAVDALLVTIYGGGKHILILQLVLVAILMDKSKVIY